MPLDTVYLDIPYMNNFVDFTVDTKNFPNLTNLSTSLHNNNQHLVLIIDAAISAEDTSNTYYSLGNSDGVFIKSGMYNSATYNGNLISSVWPKTCVFLDWFHPKSINVWSKGLNDLYNQTLFDGIWIDMNEPTTFVHGETKPSDVKTQEEIL
jgi:alpha-glucosidase (family GH31 glycosyl hydrolase)